MRLRLAVFISSIGLLLLFCGTGWAQYSITEYATGITAGSIPGRITSGPDGALWFTERSGNRIGRITTDGAITEYSGLTPGSGPTGIVTGPDGALWFTELTGDRIGRITTSGVVTEFATGLAPGCRPYSITAGPDGALWFTEYLGNAIGRITTSGVITEYPLFPAPPYLIGAQGITVGPDGALWFTLVTAGAIGRITTSGTVTLFSEGITIPADSSDFPAIRGPWWITAGPDGNLWFTEPAIGRIGRITTAGVVTEFATGLERWDLSDITPGPDGALWFTNYRGSRIGGITTGGSVRDYAGISAAYAYPDGITLGPDGAVWFAEASGKIGRIAPSAAPAPRSVPSLSPFAMVMMAALLTAMGVFRLCRAH